MKTSSLLLASLSVLAACGGGGKKDPPVNIADAPKAIDAPPACTAPSALPTTAMNYVGAYNADTQMNTTGAQEAWRAVGELDAEVNRDMIWVELFEGPPPDYTTANFPATPFTINLTGAELSYMTCSTCVSLTTDVDTTSQEFAYVDDYMATGGSVTITTLTATEITGSMTGVGFKHVDFDFDAGTQTDNASGCTSSIASLSFTAMPMAAANGSIGFKIPVKFANGKRSR